MKEVERRPREPLAELESDVVTESAANVFIPSRYKKEFGSRVRYLETYYRVLVTTEETSGKLGSDVLVHVAGKASGVGAVVAAVNQWALGCV